MRLYFTIGLARSGKSTIAKKWLYNQINFNRQQGIMVPYSMPVAGPRVVVNADKWRLALGHRYNWYLEPMIHPQTRIAARALLYDHDVLVDETNTTESSIIQWLEEDINAIPIYVDTPLEICKKRAIETEQLDLLPVLDRMQANLIKTFGINPSHADVMVKVEEFREKARKNSQFKRIV